MQKMLMTLLLSFHAAAGAGAACPLWPRPKVFSATGGTLELAGPGEAVIVMGANASEPEKYAAERLAGNIRKRFNREYPVVSETEIPEAARQLALLGRRETNAMLDRLCRENNISLSEGDPGQDGFIIEIVKDGGRDIILVGGSNARGVIYGQETFFETLGRAGDAVSFPVVSLRDWPAISWRGRPSSTAIAQMLTPGRLDAYVQARMNFVDIRGNAYGIAPPGSHGIAPADKLDEALIREVLAQAHRRGLFVYGVVDCAWKPEKGDEAEHNRAALQTFEQLLNLGCDGPWISFDDGTDGPKWKDLVQGVMDLVKRRGLSEQCVATTPPVHSYGKIETPFNREAAQLPDFAQATWFFTRPPCESDADMAREIGMPRMPAWWHNYPRLDYGGFNHSAYNPLSLRPGKKPAYVEVLPLSHGWHSPDYEALRVAAQYTSVVMAWGDATAAEEYYAGAMGIWAWSPETHDWLETRRAIYSRVFSPALAATAMAYDDLLVELKALFCLPAFKPHPGTAPALAAQNVMRLKNPADREAALAAMAKMEEALRLLEERAPGESTLLEQRLEDFYLEPMSNTLATARIVVGLDYPEYCFAEVSERIIGALEEENLPEAEKLLAESAPLVLERVERVKTVLPELVTCNMAEYAARWQRHVSDIYGFWIGTLPKFIPKWSVARAIESDVPDWAFDGLGDKVWDLSEKAGESGAGAWQKFGMKDDYVLDLAGNTPGLCVAMADLPARMAGKCGLYVRGWTRDREKTVAVLNGEKVDIVEGRIELELREGDNVLAIGQENDKGDWGKMFIGVSDPLDILKPKDAGGNAVCGPLCDWLLR